MEELSWFLCFWFVTVDVKHFFWCCRRFLLLFFFCWFLKMLFLLALSVERTSCFEYTQSTPSKPYPGSGSFGGGSCNGDMHQRTWPFKITVKFLQWKCTY